MKGKDRKKIIMEIKGKNNNRKYYLAGTRSNSAGLDLYYFVSYFEMLFSLSVFK